MPAPRKIIPRLTILTALEDANWNKRATADVLGINISTLNRNMMDYGLEPPLPRHAMVTKKEVADALKKHEWSRSSAAKELGIHRSTVAQKMEEFDLEPPEVEEEDEEEFEPIVHGSIEVETQVEEKDLPPEGKVYRYFLTCAQNNTEIHARVWDNLLLLADYYEAEIMVSRFTYNKSAYRSPKSVKPGSQKASDSDSLWYDPEIEGFLVDHRVKLTPNLEFCGEMNILPTAVRPLSGLESYTGRNSGIFPHTKLAMQSIPAGKGNAAKFNYTTGTITPRNYIQKKAGQKAQEHHVYGALLVEVNHEGHWWCRQIEATEDGELWDLTTRVSSKGKITTGNRIEGITWGDIHAAFLDLEVGELAWGQGGMLDTLRPRYQFFHDVLDFRSRIRHDMNNPHEMFWKHAHGYEDVEHEIDGVVEFLLQSHREWCESVVCDSNHDNMLVRWLRDSDYKDDPVNAVFFLKCQLRQYQALEEAKETDFHLLEELCNERGAPTTKFLRTDESFVICRGAEGGGVECGIHGHLGADGARGVPTQFARMGRKANTGHTHRAGIVDDVFTSGVMGMLRMRYNFGPSSWNHSNILTYPNGKRAISTIWAGRWKA